MSERLLAPWLRAQMAKMGLTSNRQVARYAHVSADSVGRALSGNRPDFETIQAFATYFKIDSDYLMWLAGYLNRDPTVARHDSTPADPAIERLRFLFQALSPAQIEEIERLAMVMGGGSDDKESRRFSGKRDSTG